MSKKKQNRKNYRTKKKQKANLQLILSLCLFVSLLFLMGILVINMFVPITLNKQTVEIVDTSKEDFIVELVPSAQELQTEYSVLPSIILGQAILESNWGKSELAAKYFNLFGIKNYVEGEGVFLKTKEFQEEEWIEIEGNFRVYENWYESMKDHSLLFVNGVSWDVNLYSGVLNATNYREAALALQESGYATDPDYASKIINVIETYQLDLYD